MEERQEILDTIIGRLKATLGQDREFDEDTVYADLGLKSTNYTQMLNILEDEFDVEIPYMEFKKYKTVGESVDFIVEQIEG